MSRLRAFMLLTLLGAVLLFGLEPLVGRLLLPAAGGSFYTWATCLTFFQGTLLLGYIYCHLLAPRLGRWHLLVGLLPLLFLPIAVLPAQSPLPPLLGAIGLAEPDSRAPILSLLRLLMVGVFVPFAVLSTTGVVAQAWLARSDLPGKEDPYPLYAASNLGSLAALLGYPLLIEPFLSLRAQRIGWSVLYLLYLTLLVVAAPRGAAAATSPAEAAPAEGGDAKPDASPPPAWRDIFYWLGLAAAPSAFLVAVTNVISTDIGSMPLLWVLPLAVYLLSFVLVFGKRSWYPELLQRFWPEIFIVGLFLTARQSHNDLDALKWLALALIHLAVLFVLCIVGHGELHRSRPAPRHLTTFYVVLALGGWLGGAFVTLVAPRVFTWVAEYPLAGVALGLTILVRHRRAIPAWFRSEPRIQLYGSALLLAIIVARSLPAMLRDEVGPLHVVRDVYGIYRINEAELHEDGVKEVQRATGPLGVTEPLKIRSLNHGTTRHGTQVMHERGRRIPTSYYHRKGPLGDVVAHLQSRSGPLAGAVVGLGAGTTAAHFARPGDRVTFYELDPQVEAIAREFFTYLSDCATAAGSEPRVVIGDARLKLAGDAEAPPGGYGLILVDAFSSDAIPVHLLTREAIDAFAQRLAPDGLLLYHVSNRYYELEPSLAATAHAAGLVGARRSFNGAVEGLEDPSDYVVLARRPEHLTPLLSRGWGRLIADADVEPWTDDFANLLGTLRALRGD